MTQTWYSKRPPPEPVAVTAGGIVRAILRGVPLAVNTFGCLLLLLLVRLVERPLFGQRRPITPWITQYVCRSAFFLLGMRYRVEGKPLKGAGAIVANHASWLDIFALNAPQRLYFVSKSEVAGWPGIGWLARATGTVFIKRSRSEAAAQKRLFEERLAAGHKLLFFPEGTSTDGKRVLPFRSTLFAAFFGEGSSDMALQAVTLVYEAPEGEDDRFYGWWGDMTFEEHLLKVLCVKRPGGVRVVFHEPIPSSELEGRKEAAARLEDLVRSAFTGAE
ncbi:MAG: lysophospholipid acyltransferase family protein [Pseudomonadota bacterium]